MTGKKHGYSRRRQNGWYFRMCQTTTEIKTYFKISEEEVKQFLTEIQNKLKGIVESHMYKDDCTKKEDVNK